MVSERSLQSTTLTVRLGTDPATSKREIMFGDDDDDERPQRPGRRDDPYERDNVKISTV